MKKYIPALLSAIAMFGFVPRMVAADAKQELQDLVDKVQAKIAAGKHTEEDFKDNLGEFDKLLAEHRGEKTEDVAQILAMKATLYTQVLDDDDKAIQSLKKLKADFPDTGPGKEADEMIASIEKEQAAKKIERSLAVGTPFPNFNEKDLDGKPISVAGYKGKILMVDFWATWCGPCVGELPNVQKVYEKYHDQGFAIIGVSLDQDKDTLASFIKEKNMPWPQFFDGNGWQNKLAVQYGVIQIPTTYLLGRDGRIIAKNPRGDELADAVSKAVATQQ